MKVFISGPMSGKPNSNKEAFFKAQGELMSHGYSVWNPAWFVDHCAVTEFSKDALQAISNEVLRHCDAIYMLKGWMHSEGAWNEHEIAEARELVIMYEGKCCWDKEPEDEHDVLKRHIKTVEEALAWERWKNRLTDEVESIKESIGTDNLQEQLEKDFADVYTEFQNTKDKVNDIEFGYIDWSSKMSSAIDEMEKVKETVKGLNSLVATLGEQNGVLSDKIESGIEENRHYRLSVTEQLGTIRSRLKAIDNLENTNEVHWINIQGLDKKLDELIHNVAELEKDQVDINSKVAKKLDDYKEALEKKSNDWQELQRIINNSDIENISIKAMNQKLIDLGSELDDYIDDYKEAYKHLNNADEALERRIKALEDNRGSLHEECWTEIHRLSKEIDKLNTAIDILGKDTGSIAQKRCDDNKVINNTLSTIDICLDDINNRLKAIEGLHDGITINNTLNNFNIRLKAIEKRLSIKPFYAPTEDEKDD